METQSNKIINFSLMRIATEQFALIHDAHILSDPEAQLRTDVEFGRAIDQQIIFARARVHFLNSSNNPFLIIVVNCFFNISDNSWNEVVAANAPQYFLPRDFATHISMLSLGTLRGVLHTKTEGTLYNNYLLPLLNVADMITGDILLS